MYTNFQQNSPTCLFDGQTINPAVSKFTRRTGKIVTMMTNITSHSRASEKRAFHRFAGNAVSRLLLAASLGWILSPAAYAQTPQQSWQPYGSVMQSLQQVPGPIIENVVDTSSEVMTSNLTFTIYKAPPSSSKMDYYLVAGPFSHGVSEATNNGNGAGWTTFGNNTAVAQGWCAANMDLYVTGTAADGTPGTTVNSGNAVQVNQFGPLTSGQSTETQTTSVSLGAGASGLSVDLSYTVTWDAPDVAIYTYNTEPNGVPSEVHYSVAMTTCEPVTDSLAMFPDPPSEFGTALQAAIIYQVPHGAGLQINWNDQVWWHATWFEMGDGGGTVNEAPYGQGTFVADFGSGPLYNPNGSVSAQANGPQILDANGNCLAVGDTPLVGANGTPYWQVYPKKCTTAKNADTAQNWYYTGNSQIVNVATGNCLDIQGGVSQAGTPVAGSALITTACAPALPITTMTCTASSSCTASTVPITGGTVVSQQWQLTSQVGSSPSVTGTSAATATAPMLLMSSSGYAVKAAASTYTIEQPSDSTCFVLPLNNTTKASGSCSLTPAQ